MSKITTERVAIVYVELPSANVQQDLFEIKELVRTAGGTIVLECSQKRNPLDPTTVVGSGKLEEIGNCMAALDSPIDVAIFSCQLTSTQRATLSKKLNVDVIDKIDLILDIFALRAHSAEGKKQVELAQLSYNLATKPQGDFSRQGAGIGTRGPGETKLETNKRAARERMHKLRQELKEMQSRQEVARKMRQQNAPFTVALVGYTNAGKSTLFNRLVGENIYADNLLFATLDTTVRRLALPSGIEVLLCDTVGFLNDLPHMLLDAFKSTLWEARDADLLLNVCDFTDENVANHIGTTEETLSQIGATAPLVRVFNKIDKAQGGLRAYDMVGCAAKTVFISAQNNINIDTLLDVINDYALQEYATIKLKVDFANSGALLAKLNKYSNVVQANYLDDGVLITTTLRRKFVKIFADDLIF